MQWAVGSGQWQLVGASIGWRGAQDAEQAKVGLVVAVVVVVVVVAVVVATVVAVEQHRTAAVSRSLLHVPAAGGASVSGQVSTQCSQSQSKDARWRPVVQRGAAAINTVVSQQSARLRVVLVRRCNDACAKYRHARPPYSTPRLRPLPLSPPASRLSPPASASAMGGPSRAMYWNVEPAWPSTVPGARRATAEPQTRRPWDPGQ